MTDQTAVSSTGSKPRRRWKRLLGISGGILLGVILLILLAVPPIVGAVAKSRIESDLGEALQAEVRVEDVSFGWSGALSLTGLKIVPAGFTDPLLEIPEAKAEVSLLSAIAGSYITDVEVIGPRLLIERGADGRFNYEIPELPEPEEKAEKNPDTDPDTDPNTDPSGASGRPSVQATLKIRGGELLVRAEGAETVYRNLTLDVRVDTLERPIDFALSFEDPEGGRVDVKGMHTLDGHRGPLTVTLENLSLANLSGAARAYLPVASLEGRLSGQFGYEMNGLAAFAGTGRLELEGQVTLPDGNVVPLDGVRVNHSGTLSGAGDGRHDLSFVFGKALSVLVQAEVREVFDAPVASMTFSARSELSELGRALEKSAGLKPGFALAGSAGMRGRLEVTGFNAIQFDVTADAKNLEAVDPEGKRIEIDPAIRFKAAGSWDGTQRSLDLREFVFGSSFAEATARGGLTLSNPVEVRESSISAHVKLDELASRLGTILADPPDVKGMATIRGTYAGDRFDLTVEVRDLTYTTEKDGKPSTVGPITATLVQKGVLGMRPGGALRIEKATLSSSAIEAELSGEIASVLEAERNGRLTLRATVRPAGLSGWIEGLHLGGPEVPVTATLDIQPDATSLSGEAALEALTIGEGEEKQTLRAKKLAFRVGRKGEELAARVNGTSLQWERGGYVVRADVESSIVHGGKTSAGTTKLSRIEVTDPEKRSAKEAEITIVHELGLSGEAVEIRKAGIESAFLRGDATGTVTRREGEVFLDAVRGTFRYHPSRLGAVLAPWLPGTLEGEEERALELRLSGKAKDADLFSILRGSKGSVDLDLARFTTTGLSLSGRTRLELEDGRVVGRSPLEVNGGKAEVHLVLDVRAPDPKRPSRSTLWFKTENVAANGKMGPLLSKMSPLLYVAGIDAALDGVVQSEFNLACDVPLDAGPRTESPVWANRLTGRGTLAIDGLSVRGSPVVGLLLDVLAATGNRAEGKLLPTEIVIGGGKCRYRNMTLELKRYRLSFSGWVAFDGSMELLAETPITEPLAKRYPLLRRFFGKTLFVPLTGTVARPHVDWAGAVREFIKRNAPGALLEELLRRSGKKGGKEPPKNAEPKSPLQELLEGLLNRNRKKEKKK